MQWLRSGVNHSLALKNDSVVVRWDEELNGGLFAVPSKLGGVVAIRSG